MATEIEYRKREQADQLTADLDQALDTAMESRLKRLHTGIPAIITSFDAALQTVQVQPALQRIFSELGAVNLPLCLDVPVVFTGGGNFFLTFPPVAGDECWLAFSERCIDFWFARGGVQLPAEYRMHDLSDAVAFVGINSRPRALENFNTAGPELRNRDRSLYFGVGNDGKWHIKGDVVQDSGGLTSAGVVWGCAGVQWGTPVVTHAATHVHPTAGTGAPSAPTLGT